MARFMASFEVFFFRESIYGINPLDQLPQMMFSFLSNVFSYALSILPRLFIKSKNMDCISAEKCAFIGCATYSNFLYILNIFVVSKLSITGVQKSIQIKSNYLAKNHDLSNASFIFSTNGRTAKFYQHHVKNLYSCKRSPFCFQFLKVHKVSLKQPYVFKVNLK